MANSKFWRCTRNEPYPPGSQGYHCLEARQGYYIHADAKEEAIAKMARLFPEDSQGFTAHNF